MGVKIIKRLEMPEFFCSLISKVKKFKKGEVYILKIYKKIKTFKKGEFIGYAIAKYLGRYSWKIGTLSYRKDEHSNEKNDINVFSFIPKIINEKEIQLKSRFVLVNSFNFNREIIFFPQIIPEGIIKKKYILQKT